MFGTFDLDGPVKPLADSLSCFIDANGPLLGVCLRNREPIGCLPLVDRMLHGVSFSAYQPDRWKKSTLCEAVFVVHAAGMRKDL